MATHDVSALPQFESMLVKQKVDLQAAQSRKGQCPTVRKSREELINTFNLRLLTMLGRNTVGEGDMKTIVVPPSYPPCTRPLRDLRLITIQNLRLEIHHKGTYALLRTVTVPARMSSITAIVEDECGDALVLQLYHREKENERAATELLAESTILAVKEPFFCIMADGDIGLRVDHVSDVVFFPDNDERLPIAWLLASRLNDITAKSWETKGDAYMSESKHYAAIKCYTRAFDSSPTTDGSHAIMHNRCRAFLKTQQFDAALRDAELVPPTAENSLYRKTIYMKALALYSLRRYRESCEVLETLSLEYPNSCAPKDLSTRTFNRLQEQCRGRFSFQQLYKEAIDARPPHLDHATYLGPVSIKPSGSRGRGLFTTKAVKAGDLLLCEKAFAHAFIDNKNVINSQDIGVLIDTETDSIRMGAQAELVTMIIQKLHRNPSLTTIITDLCHGAYQPVGHLEVDGMPVVDTFLIHRIVALNCFGCPISTRDDWRADGTKQGNKSHHSCGIWPTASYINHSCNSNAHRSFIGDMMMVRAAQDLSPDTEITFWYQKPAPNSPDKLQKSLRNWDFECDCAICRDEKSAGSGILLKRKQMQSLLMRYTWSNKAAETTTQRVLPFFAQTYRKSAVEVPRLILSSVQVRLAVKYMVQGQPVEAAHMALQALGSLGYVIEGGDLPRTKQIMMVIKKWGLMVDGILDCWVVMAWAYHLVAPDLEVQAKDYARITYKVCIGEDDSFEEEFARLRFGSLA